MTQASRARVRHVGGYYIAKVRHEFVTKKSHRYSVKQTEEEYEKPKCAVKMLYNLRIYEHSV